jgi:hypothetical protein
MEISYSCFRAEERSGLPSLRVSRIQKGHGVFGNLTMGLRQVINQYTHILRDDERTPHGEIWLTEPPSFLRF